MKVNVLECQWNCEFFERSVLSEMLQEFEFDNFGDGMIKSVWWYVLLSNNIK